MTMETLWVDFNNTKRDGVWLWCRGTLDELVRKNITLATGQKYLIWMEDFDNDEAPDHLVIEAEIVFSKTDNCLVAAYEETNLNNNSKGVYAIYNPILKNAWRK